ncbi:PDZ domain [hydrothermal vent metagenome]|uniref:PDZ domain n=1 Tax=hydrothermal vent metagenome TaxID=652676 RepID=A0A3B1DY15_9ZZZZ
MFISHLVSAIGLGLLVGCAATPPTMEASGASMTAEVATPVAAPGRAGEGDEESGAASLSVEQPSAEQPWAPPPIERAVTVFDGRTGEILPFAEMLDRLAAVDAVFLGETHIDETTHRVELAVYEGLLARRDGGVVLAMEMFERDVQPVLDAYLAGEIEEKEFIKKARAWGQYRSAYRPMVERARADGLPVVASNFPRALTRRIGREGLGVLDTLEGDERRHAPTEIFPNSPEYWKRVDNAVRGHLAMMRRSGGDDERLTSTQTLWDNAMGDSCAVALDDHPGSMVLHVNGGFHSMYWGGTVRQLLLRKPEARVLTVAIYSARNPAATDIGGVPVADFVVMAETRAMDKNEGTWAVVLDRQLKYRLHLPATATEAEPVPLLLWFGEAGLTSEDGMELWKDRLGDDAAIVVIEPPYRARLDDRSEGGRWYWADTAAEDVGSLVGATERIWAYLMRYYPIDPARVSVAGEGTGATVVAAIALLGDRMDHAAVAFDPKQYAKLKDYPLPLPEYGDGDERAVSLLVSGSADDASWWEEELAAYREVGLTTSFVQAGESAAGRDQRQEAVLREVLGLPVPTIAAEAESVSIVIPAETPRSRHWSRLYALRYAAETGKRVTLLAADTAGYTGNTLLTLTDIVHPSTIGDAIPRCPGPFGGTTVLVLPADVPAADVKAWIALEENDPLNKASRFHRLRIAVDDADAGERALSNMLETLEGEGRKNVLIVPAVFCADPDMMRKLEHQTRAFGNRMTIQWLPGLGGEELPVGVAAVDAALGTVEHELRVVLEPTTGGLTVEDTVTLPPAVRGAGAEFTLNSALTITKSEPPVRRVGVVESEGGPEKVRYALESAAPEGILRIAYEGTMDFGLSDQKEEYARGFRETHGIVGPEGVFLNGGSAWIIQFADEMIRFTVEIEAPSDWHVISQGNGSSDVEGESGGRRIARWSSGADLEQVYLVGGPLTVEREMAGSVEVLVYLYEMDETLSRKYLDATARYIEMYRKLIGPYPYEKFALVENFWETGFGMPSFTLLGSQVIRLPFILHSSYPHEILHNWWGNSVFVEYESGNWCEGLTAYMADHLIQEQRGKGDAYRRGTLQKFRNYVKEGRDFPLTEFRSRHSAATEAVGYGKALMTYHMLRLRVGDDAFRAAFVDFYRKNRGLRASFDDIRASFESVTGEDLSAFFAQWIERPGAPSLVVRDAEVAGPDGGVYTVTGTLAQVQRDDPFVLSVPIVIATEAGQESFVVEMNNREVEFALAVSGKPVALAVDPAFDLFRLLSPFETPSSIGQLFGEPKILAILPSEAGEDAEAYTALMEGWRTDDHAIEIVRDDEVESLPADQAVWILGRTNRFAGEFLAFASGVEAAEPVETVALGDDLVSVSEHSIIVIRRHPDNPEKAIGWISVEPGAAFPGVGRKLPHYGKYSYLAFEGDEPTNIVKGQWETTDSPLVVEFAPGGAASIAVEPRAALAELPPVFSQRKLREHVAWLAAPERQGRGLGTPELAESAEYIAQQLAEAGLEPGGDDGTWFQRFTVAEGPDGEPVEAVNVVGVLPGKRGDWSEQSIVLGAHYDHLGLGWPDVRTGEEGKVHAGADDNASGVSVMIEVARNLAAEGGGSRNLVVIAFSGEEAGLKGSRHYVANPRFPVAGIRGMINLDTVGRLRDGEIAIHATGTADEWQHIFRGVGFVTGVKSRNVAARVGGSDQDSFIDAGVPAVQFFTGAHADYHRPTDTPDKVDDAGLVQVATFVKESLAYILEREEPMNVRIEGVAAAPAGDHRPAEGGRRVSFGTVPQFDFAGPGVKVESVVPGSPAELAGLHAGDVLLSLDGTPLADLRAFSQHLRTLTPGQEVVAVVLRDGAEVTLPVRVEAR